MREIKFRAWGKHDSSMHYEVGVSQAGSPIYNGANWVGGALMQYTDLKDKNGKEIYEGDIIQAVYPNILEPLMRKRGERYEIVFRMGAFKAFDLATKEGNIEDSFLHDKSFGRAHLEGYEIIGNIYENPELLTKKE